MTGTWMVAAAALTLLVIALTVVLARLLRVVASLDRTVAILREKVRRLETLEPGQPRSARSESSASRPSAVHVTLDPECAACRDLVLDLRVTGAADLPLPLRVLVEDGSAGRQLVKDFPLPVEFERTVSTGQANGVPHVFVLSETGAVLAKGNPATVAELGDLVRR